MRNAAFSASIVITASGIYLPKPLRRGHLQVVAQFDDAPSKPEPRTTQSATKLFVLRLSFVDLRALCGGRFGKMSHYRTAGCPRPATMPQPGRHLKARFPQTEL